VIGFWALAATLAGAVAAILLWPLARRPQATTRAEYDLSVYRDQLKEIDRDLERGLFDAAQAEAARIEIQRRMLAAAEVDASAPARRDERRRAIAVALLAALVPVAGFGFYLAVGAPGTPGFAYAERASEVANAETRRASREDLKRQVPDIEDAMARLRERLKQDSENLEGWLVLARSSMVMERYKDAAEAYGRAFVLSNRAPDIAADYAEALIMADGATVTPQARQALDSAVQGDPTNPKGRYYLGLAKAQAGDTKGALQDWVDLVALSPPDAPWLAIVRQQMARAGQELGLDPARLAPSSAAAELARKAQAKPPEPTGPSAADVEAAEKMSADERATMIRGMVERLAARLQANPNDREGWLRLARAYEVLGDSEKAKEARARAAAASQ
jgi:cytochrome c-type biogenesis protein CcmH